MAVANRKITVVVDGTSKELQTAVRAALDSIKQLSSAITKQSQLSIDWGDKVIKSNDAVAASYGRIAEAVTGSTTKVSESVGRQAQAVAESSTVIDDATKTQVDAYTRVAATANRTALDVSAAADRQAKAVAGAADATTAAAEKSATASRDSSAKQAAAFGASSSGLVKFGKLVTETAAAVAVGSLYMSAKFEASTTRLLTQAGATEGQIKQMRSSILSMAGSLGQTPEHLSEGLYHIVSSMNRVLPAATRTSEELKIMKIAAEGAAIGNTSMEETTYALASAMNALHQHAGQAEHTMALLNAIVGSGDMTMTDLLAALKSGLIPTLQTYGISLQSAGAALAVMGDQGMRGALAGTRLRMSLSLIAAPSEKAAKVLGALGMSAGEIHAKTTAMSEALEKAGLSTTTMAADLRKPDGIVAALSDLKNHLEKSGLNATEVADVFGRAFGGGRMSASIMLLAESAGRVGTKYEQIGQQVGSFGSDWSKTQQTLAFQAKQAFAALEALGVKIGKDLTPAAETLLHDLKDVAVWLEHNKAAAEALAFAVTSVLGVAVTAFLANKVSKMVSGLKEMQAASAWLRAGFRTPGAAAAETAAASTVAPAATEGLSATSGMLIGGARSGYGLPGSLVNPLVVAVESGEYAGLGGRAAASEVTGATAAEQSATESSAARAEVQTAKGVWLPPGAAAEAEKAAQTTAAESVVGAGESVLPEAVVGGSLLGGLRTAAGGVLANAMKGGLYAVGGTLASQLLGGIVGGKTGKDISSIGTGASVGAGIGTVVLGPGVGTAIGAAIGAAPGVIKALEGASHAEHEAHAGNTKGGPTGQVFKEAEEAQQRIGAWEEKMRKSLPSRNATSVQRASIQNYNREIYEQGQHQIGEIKGRAEAAYVIKGTKNPYIGEIVTQTKAQLDSLSPMAREGYINMIKMMVSTLEKEERLPKNAIQKLVGAMKPELEKLPHYAAESAQDLSAQMANNINFENARGQLEQNMNQIKSQWASNWKLMSVTPSMTMQEVESTMQSNLAKLQYLMGVGPKRAREEAVAQFKKLKPELEGLTNAATGGVENSLASGSSQWKKLAREGVSAIVGAYNILPTELKDKLENAGGVVSKEVKKINEQLYKELTELNGGKPPKSLREGGAPLAPGVEKQAEKHSTGAASGALIQIGRRGEGGTDTVPLNIGGIPVKAGRGEKVAIFNRHQEARLNQRLADEGGLTGFFSRNKRPNYMASGGFVPGFAPGDAYAGLTRGRVDQGVDFGGAGPVRAVAGGNVMSVGLWPGWPGTGGIVYSTPRGVVYVMEDFAPSVTAGQPLTAGEVIGRATGGSSGIETGWANSSGTAPIVRYGTAPDGTPMAGGKSFSAFLGGAATSGSVAAAIAGLIAPKVKEGGIGGQIAQMVLNNIVEAANTKLGGTSGASFGAPSASALPAAARAKLMQIASARAWSAADWLAVIGLESGGNPAARNASGAYGIGQALGGTQQEFPKMVSSNPSVQIEGMAEYIASRYGNPSGALAHEHAYHWYGQGGLVEAAGGSEDVARAASTKFSGILPRPLKITTPSKKAATKTKITKSASPHAHVKSGAGKSTLAKKLGSLKFIAGLEELPEVVAPFETQLAALANLGNLVKAFESDRDGPVILASDMQYLAGLGGRGVTPGMTVADAYSIYERTLAEVGGNPDLELEGAFVKWAEQQANHRLLTSGQAGILGGAGARVGWTPKAGTPLMGINEDIADLELNQLEHEKNKVGGLMHRLAEVAKERVSREHHARVLKSKAEKREKNLKADLRRLGTSSVKAKLAAAVNAAYQSERVQDAQEHAAAIAVSKADLTAVPSKERSRADTAELNHLNIESAQTKAFLTAVKNPVKSKIASVQQAELAVLKNTINNELAPISEQLKTLNSSEPGVSVKGLLSEVKAIDSAESNVEGEYAAITASKIPTVQINLEEITRAMQLSEIPRITSPTSTENTALVEALRAQNAVLSTEKAISQAQFATLKNFELNVPHFEKGGPVLEDGLAYVHRGEHVVPREGALVASGGAPNITLEHHTNVHGSIAPLLELIDSRVQAPHNINAISRAQGLRVQNFPGFAAR